MEQYLIDTNVVSDYLSASLPPSSTQFMDEIIDAIPTLSIVSQIELLCWQTHAETETKVLAFLNDCSILNIDNRVVAMCVQIRKGNRIKMPDAIIAATAIASNLTLLTNDEKDFQRIAGLRFINPWKV